MLDCLLKSSETWWGEKGKLSKRVQHFATSLHGTNSYWFKQRSRLTAMVDTLGLPTVFLTHSSTDMQWLELAHLICPHKPIDKK